MLEINTMEPDPSSSQSTFKVKSACEMCYSEFFHHFMAKNAPCLIRHGMDDWPAIKDLTTDTNEPNVDFLEKISSQNPSKNSYTFLYEFEAKFI